ncbi:MAG TPA: ADP/ATP-dependent (S)-NAD(P)H-hydrate dehydratase, partial [Caldimonas sp.]|nr:ADP/ATP-dependent (S)-NAD(P)H-hydrate dehydratase [Caldimonas sp.]
ATTVVCGCGGADAVRAPLPRLLSLAPRLVLDADALNAIAADASLLALVTARTARGLATILTPHPLEAARLLGSTTAQVQADRVAAARALAERSLAVVVLKGSGTVIAAPDEVPRINATGNASLASAGTGDVLAGWIGGRWAATARSTIDIATRAVVEHGAAAEPERGGAIRAADLIETLHLRARDG